MLIKKRKLFINYLKEERWINEMAAQGFHLVNYKFGRYLFKKGKPGGYEYRIELLKDTAGSEAALEYLDFMEESGIILVAKYSNWVYFRKKATKEPFMIYTDYDQRKEHLQRIIKMLAIIMFVNLGLAVLNTSLSSVSTLNGYVSILSWLIVICLFVLILQYLKNIRELKQQDTSFTE